VFRMAEGRFKWARCGAVGLVDLALVGCGAAPGVSRRYGPMTGLTSTGPGVTSSVDGVLEYAQSSPRPVL